MNHISPGDSVLFYHNERLSYLRKVQEKGNFECHKGRIPWAEIIGGSFGSEITTHLGIKFILLQPSLADLMIGVKRRTTIAYPKDAGYILLRASIAPGVRVAEVGSGSGALTTILARYVMPQGHVFSFERRPEFLKLAEKNVQDAGLSDHVTFHACDVSLSGFADVKADVCVVDVPEPWSIVRHAAQALNPAGRWVSLSPTTEQLQKTRVSLEEFGFRRLEVWEVLLRQMRIRAQGSRPKEQMISHTAYLCFADLAGIKPGPGMQEKV